MNISREELGEFEDSVKRFEQYSKYKRIERESKKSRNKRLLAAGIGATGYVKFGNIAKLLPDKYKKVYLGATVGLPVVGAAISHRVALSSREKANNLIVADTVGISDNSERVKKSWDIRRQKYGKSGSRV
jgi:hypothetical protein